MRYLDIDSWNRKEQYSFFKDFDNPYYNICVNLDISKFLNYVKNHKLSFSFASLYLSLKSANDTESLRYRTADDRVVIHDAIHAGQTIFNDDKTFSFCYFEYRKTFGKFQSNADQVLAEHRANPKKLNLKSNQGNLIHYSSMPWISFTSISHARKFDIGVSVPKMVFGKYFNDYNGIKMPFSIEVSHALMDGYHVAEYLDLFQSDLNNPEKYLK